MIKARVSEVFYSIQGEGIYQYTPQVFIRFWGCDLRCSFCDTRPSYFRYLDKGSLLREVFSQPGSWDWLSLTGGEPLAQAEFLKDFLPEVRSRGKKIYLETNGVLYRQFKEVIDLVDVIAMDFKLPSSTKLRSFWPEHREFLLRAKAKEVFVKAVITPETEQADILESLKILREVDPSIPLVLQPVFSYEAFLAPKLEGFKSLAQEFINRVEIIPQIHKRIGVR